MNFDQIKPEQFDGGGYWIAKNNHSQKSVTFTRDRDSRYHVNGVSYRFFDTAFEVFVTICSIIEANQLERISK